MLTYAYGRRCSQPSNCNHIRDPNFADDLSHACSKLFCVLARNARTVKPGVRMLDMPKDAAAHNQAAATIVEPEYRR